MSKKISSVHEKILGFSISAAPFSDQMSLIMDWAKRRQSRFVGVANVHMLMEGYWQEKMATVMHSADLLTPDGMPLVWMMNVLGRKLHDRVNGMAILQNVCERASKSGVKVYFLGSDALTLEKMRLRLNQDFPLLQIAGMDPLPFRPLTPEEDRALVKTVNASQAGIVFVALGCPKQELWMYEHQHKIQAVMLGIGGVFPIYAGMIKYAPGWVQKSGLEWLYRLKQEPGRLWKRYMTTIPPFIYLSLKQILTEAKSQRMTKVSQR